jgi:membrane protease YdiL (CAAX protease family)
MRSVMYRTKVDRGVWCAGPWPYFLVALGWSWAFWIPIAASGTNITVVPGVILYVLGGFGPPVAGIGLTVLTCDRLRRLEYWRRLVEFKRIGPKWCGVIFLTAPVYSGLTILTGLVTTGKLPRLDVAAGYLTHPITIAPFLITALLYGPIPEELGWRGYALERLLSKRNALTSSLVLGAMWSIWHIPMFFMRGTPISTVFPLWSIQFWVAMGPGILAESIIMTWIYNNTGNSTLSAVLFHFMMNFTGEFLGLPPGIKNYQFMWLVVIAVVVVILYGPRTLSRNGRNGELKANAESA